ncbi:MAG: sodium:proton antiporter [Solirubrobacterales bacterium]
MEWTLAIVALAVIGVAAISNRLTGTPVTPAMVLIGLGLIIGPQLLGGVGDGDRSAAVRALAEATLALLLFCDASRIDLRRIDGSADVSLRLLAFGLPLTIGLGAIAAGLVFDQLSLGEALVLGVILAPTDAALGQAVITAREVPTRIRQGLNVESGLNDGICVPLLFAAVAAADVESHIAEGRSAATLLLEEIGYGMLGGIVAGALIAGLIVYAGRRGLISKNWRQVIPAGGAALAFGIAEPLGGSGFVAAFVAGLAFRLLLREDPGELNEFSEEIGSVLNGVTFFFFGAVLLRPALDQVTWEIVLYAALSLTAVRMVPVILAMIGSGARPPTLAFLGWFGPRGLASIVFAVILIEESSLPYESLIVVVAFVTVGISVLLHGLSAAPLARRYGRWYETHPPRQRPPMESVEVEVGRARGPRLRWPRPF